MFFGKNTPTPLPNQPQYFSSIKKLANVMVWASDRKINAEWYFCSESAEGDAMINKLFI